MIFDLLWGIHCLDEWLSWNENKDWLTRDLNVSGMRVMIKSIRTVSIQNIRDGRRTKLSLPSEYPLDYRLRTIHTSCHAYDWNVREQHIVKHSNDEDIVCACAQNQRENAKRCYAQFHHRSTIEKWTYESDASNEYPFRRLLLASLFLSLNCQIF